MTGLPFEPIPLATIRRTPPLEPWMLSMAREATDVDADAIPRDMMWARLQHRRAARPGAPRAVIHTAPRRREWVLRVAGLAAVLVGGIGVGRYLLPATGPSKYQLAAAAGAAQRRQHRRPGARTGCFGRVAGVERSGARGDGRTPDPHGGAAHHGA